MERLSIEQVRDLCDMLIAAGMGDEGFRYYQYIDNPDGRDMMGVTSVTIYKKDGKDYPVFHGDE